MHPHRRSMLRAPFLSALALLVCGWCAGAAPARADRVATYLPGTLTFSENVNLKCPLSTRDGEPSIRVDVRGNCYVGAIRGVPAGVDLWRVDLNPSSPTFDPGMQNPLYLGQPDAFLPTDPNDPTTGGADGGGDIDIAVSFPTSPDSTPVVTITSLALADISSAYSYDRGQTFTLSPAVAIAPVDDRQWCEATGPNTVYLIYRSPAPADGLFSQRSDDHGRTYGLPALVNSATTTPGYIDVDHASGRVYAAHMGGSLSVARSSDQGMTWANSTVDATTQHGALFDVVKVGADGTVYAVWCDTQNVYLSHSIDGGVTWKPKVRVNDNTIYQTSLFPWLEAGSDGRVCVVWYGTPNTGNNDNSDWSVLLAQSLDAKSDTPTFRQQVVSDHVIHGSNISTGGLTGGANRNLIDYFQVALDPQGAAVIAFTDDHNDFDGHTWVTRQLDGASLYAAANGNGTVDPVYPPPLPGQDFGLPEVTDYLHDATAGLLQPIPNDNPFDILSIDYSCQENGNDPLLVATMKLSALMAIPVGIQWRVNFTANAPGTTPGHPGVSDNGDQFWMMASTDSAGLQSFTWGTAVRGGDGSTTYTERGNADFGQFDQANKQVILKVAVSRLNAFANPDIVPGSVLAGLRGQTLEPGFEGPPGNRHPLRDHTLGGGTFTFPGCGLTGVSLAAFHAETAVDGILLRWQFEADAAFLAVAVERAERSEGPWSPLAVEITREGAVHSALDRTAQSGHSYYYHLIATQADRSTVTFGPWSVTMGAPLRAGFLGSPAPNPTRGTCSVDFAIGKSSPVDLAVYDVHGRRVRSIYAGALAPGRYTKVWDGRTDRFSDANAGVYFFVLNSGEGIETQRVSMVR